MYRLLFFISLCVISLRSFAHVGHDHNVPMAVLIHLAWLAPLVIVGVYLINKLVRYQSTKDSLLKENLDNR
ncbi:hypothetical protein [Colwellia sp. E2M01]|uniref:hypothetical protein n=1 Tax=Colwellia sp. E2M01 TaxID=2841561 RepID=UPI001C09C25E|nr:hypothetical protein [Colwellia sp. E2M01]MBU2870595.1 hypothetical protein [Colwellia sp. E2M01]